MRRPRPADISSALKSLRLIGEALLMIGQEMKRRNDAELEEK